MYIIGHSKMELTDVDFSFQNFNWLFENNETDQVIVCQFLAILKK